MTKDIRPFDCRFRAQEEGRPYPRSSCRACGRSSFTGLGNRCYLEREVAPGTDVGSHSLPPDKTGMPAKDLFRAASDLQLILRDFDNYADIPEEFVKKVATVRARWKPYGD